MAKLRMTLHHRKAIGRRLKIAREGVRLTQTQAARRLGLQVTTTLSNYEQGRTEIPLRLLPSLCELYHVKFDTLLLGQDQRLVADLDTRRRMVQIQRQGAELVRELAELVWQLEVLFSNDDRPRKRARA